MRKIVGTAHFSIDEILTALAKIESVINSRSLSYVSSSDLDEPLTPSHLSQFWSCWRDEYLSELRAAHSHSERSRPNIEHPGPSVREVVLVHDEHLRRGLWKLGNHEGSRRLDQRCHSTSGNQRSTTHGNASANSFVIPVGGELSGRSRNTTCGRYGF